MKINPKPFIPLLTGFYRLWHKLVRYDAGEEWRPVVDCIRAGTPAVVALWHNELFAISGYGSMQESNYVIVVSQSRDGELIAGILEGVGHTMAKGSSSRGGLRALLTMVKEMKKGKVGVFTVDGPRGPRHEVKEGVVFAAQRADALVFPIRAYARKKLVFNSWDRFEVPYPFSRCRIRVGEPLKITSEKLTDEVMEQEKARVKEALMNLTEDS